MALPSDISFFEGDLLFLAAITFIVYSDFEVSYADEFSFANLLLKDLLLSAFYSQQLSKNQIIAMNSSVEVEEQTHKYWKAGTYISALLCLILFTTFWNISDAFWISILRLSSFAFFSLAILGYLNIMNGPLNIITHFSDDKLLVTYKKENRTVHEEQFDVQSIDQLFLTQSRQNLVQKLFLPQSATLKVSFNDTENNLYVFEFGGRPLFLEQPMLEKVTSFFQAHGITVNSSKPQPANSNPQDQG